MSKQENNMNARVLAAAAVLVAGLAGTAFAQGPVRVGLLECRVAGGVGFILGSSKALDCTYRPANRRYIEHYVGRINKFGVDIGATGESVIAWGVFAPSQVGPGALAGVYGGATAEATLAVGVGANVLIGGFERSLALQPVSIQGQTGVNVAAGIAEMTLQLAN
jgi:hypothetical protein